jgi:hypothetical protein
METAVVNKTRTLYRIAGLYLLSLEFGSVILAVLVARLDSALSFPVKDSPKRTFVVFKLTLPEMT